MISVRTAVDPEVTMILKTISDRMIELEHPPLEVLTPEQSRHFYRAAREFFMPIHVEGVAVEDTSFLTKTDQEIPIRIYTPKGKGPFPILVYFHGGGWVFGDLDSSDNVCRFFASQAGIVVVSAGYRLAPEHKYPAAFLDAVESVRWAFQNIKKLNGDLTRFIVGGESSGGNLAAAAIFFMEHEKVRLSHQFLITPVLDYNFNTLSYRANFQFNLTTEKMKWFWGHYLQDPSQGSERFASPLKVPCVKKLPDTLLVTAEFDPLRDEGFAFSERLKNAGVEVEHLHYEDQVHSFINMIGTANGARAALSEMAIKLREMIYS